MLDISCPDCRTAFAVSASTCPTCGWALLAHPHYIDCLGSGDRTSGDAAEYIETYNILAERNLTVPVESNRYVENLSKRLVDLLGDLAGKDVCDVGAGRGFFIKHALAKNPRSLTAVDIAAPSLRAITSTYQIPGFLANAERLPFLRAFDVISATDILEHVLNMANFLVTANWALRDGGILAVRVPYFENMLYYSNYHGLPMHFTHLRTFDKALLVHTVQSVGFKVEHLWYDGFNPSYMQGYLDRFPALRLHIQKLLRRKFGSDDDVTTINAVLGRALMRPIEIGAIARKISHIEPVHAHKTLAEFCEGRNELQGASPCDSSAKAISTSAATPA